MELETFLKVTSTQNRPSAFLTLQELTSLARFIFTKSSNPEAAGPVVVSLPSYLSLERQ